MASELIAEAITDYFGERCPDYAEGCPTCEAWAEYDRLKPRPAPADGLERYRPEPMSLGGMVRDTDGGYVTRSQADAIIRDLETKILDAAISDRLDDAGSPLTWQERAEKAEADLAAERAEHDNTIATLTSLITDNAALIHDLNRIKDHETELVNDNAALTARIKELETELENGGRVKGVNTQYANALAYLEMTEDDDPEEFAKRTWDERKALEAKLAAAQKALESYKSIVKDVCESQRGTKWGKAAECIFDAIERAVLGGKPS